MNAFSGSGTGARSKGLVLTAMIFAVAMTTRDVLYGMAIIMAVATFVALRGLRRGVQEEPEAAGTRLSDSVIGE